ncbi:MAG: FAD:protein FMN transferase [Oscillospiraceae bacterium]
MDFGKNKKRTIAVISVMGVLCIAVLVAIFVLVKPGKTTYEEYSTMTFAMDTVITQSAHGPNAQKAMEEVNIALADWEKEFSMYQVGSDIDRINAAAGKEGVEVSERTATLLKQAVELSATSEGVFAITIAPLSKAWGINTDHARVVPQDEIDQLKKLVDDNSLIIEGTTVTLLHEGMGIDLGGIAKGAACSIAKEIYQKYNLDGALLSIGGNVYAYGNNNSGNQYRIGFRDPSSGNENAFICSFTMKDLVIAVSGGYERYSDIDGERYIHIIDPRTGAPAQSDIVSVGAIREDGAISELYSTTYFIWGKERTLQDMREGGVAIMLDDENNLYVSASLEDSFNMNAEVKDQYNVIFVEGS